MTPARRVVIGTRGSALARWQADHVTAELARLSPGVEITQQIIVTEAALLAGTIDLAVHSLKDVPATLAPGLVLAAIPPRADPRDVLISRDGHPLRALAPGSRVGTSSLRRVCQVRALRADLSIELLRGNVDTRLRKVAEGVVDAAILAAAGLDRLGFGARITERLSTEDMLPAIGQGALAIETRADDAPVLALCRLLADRAAEITVAAERALLGGLGAGCRTPVAGYATVDGDVVTLRGLVGRPDASEILTATESGPTRDAAAVGATLASRLLARGAGRILAELGDL
jgi:hydroxymethylbilane synthase